MSLIEGNTTPLVRMAHLAIVGSHSTNGVAQIHSDLLRTRVVSDFAEMFPDRFNNKTNGVTPRRWLLSANPDLAGRSSDRAIREYAADIWHVEPCPTPERDGGPKPKRSAKAGAKP